MNGIAKGVKLPYALTGNKSSAEALLNFRRIPVRNYTCEGEEFQWDCWRG